MNRRLQRIIGINPGTRYLGIAVLDGSELLDWRIRALEGKWSEKKINKVIEILSELFDRYEPNVFVIKKLHPARRSENLLRLANKIKDFARCKKLKVYQYSIKEIESFFIEDEKLNKQNLIDAIANLYPILHNDLSKERSQKNAYYIRAFEAVALASACSQRLGKS
jgi:Holliday junction resolvasome RuvABC endonuclease subunit